MSKKRVAREPEITAAIISVVGTIVGTLLISILLGFLEGRIGLGTVVGVVIFLLLIAIWVLLALRWGVRLAGSAAAVMVIVGSVFFLAVTAGRIIPSGLFPATPVAFAPSPTRQPMATQTPSPTRQPMATQTATSLPPAPTTPPPTPAPPPGGQCRVAYEQDGDIYVKNCDGSGVTRLTNHPAGGFEPAWSPDGQRIVFASQRDRQPLPEGYTPASLYIVDADGSNLTRLTFEDWFNDMRPDWSPDGSRIAFHRHGMLAMVNPDGSDLKVILEESDNLTVSYLAWSPDGQRLAFTNEHAKGKAGGYWTVHVINADGTGLLKLAVGFEAERVTALWSPDGSQLGVEVFTEAGPKYCLINADGSGEPVEVPSIPESWYPWYWPKWVGSAEMARAFAEPILAAIADRPPDFSEDFSDATSGWDVGMEGEGKRGYVNGEYFILAPPAEAGTSNCTHGGWGWGAEFSDFVLKVDGRFLSGSGGDWQVHFRNNPEGFYAVHLALDGKGDVSAVRDKAMRGLAHFQGPPIRAGVEANTLQIIAKGSQIAVVVNGEPLAHARDESFSGGTIILVVCNGGDTPLEVRFDNFKVWDISGLSL